VFDVCDPVFIRLDGMFPLTGSTRELASGDHGKQQEAPRQNTATETVNGESNEGR
jgi:hypothetical protein